MRVFLVHVDGLTPALVLECSLIYYILFFLQAFAMFLIVYGISFPLDEGVAHSLSIAGTLLYVLSLSILSSKPLRGLGWFGDKGIGGDPWRRKSIAIQNCCSSLAEGLLRTFCGNYTCGFLNVWKSFTYIMNNVKDFLVRSLLHDMMINELHLVNV
jgi:hypothetical protein